MLCHALVLTSLPLSLALLVMLRHAAPLRPAVATLTGSLAVAAITATALSLAVARPRRHRDDPDLEPRRRGDHGRAQRSLRMATQRHARTRYPGQRGARSPRMIRAIRLRRAMPSNDRCQPGHRREARQRPHGAQSSRAGAPAIKIDTAKIATR
jgi:hypothetical protein